MSVPNQTGVATPYLSEADLAGMTLQERRDALLAASLARAQEAHRLSLLDPARPNRPTRFGRVRNSWKNAYD